MSLFGFLTGCEPIDENDLSCPTCKSRFYKQDPREPGKMAYICKNGHRFGFLEDMGP